MLSIDIDKSNMIIRVRLSDLAVRSWIFCYDAVVVCTFPDSNCENRCKLAHDLRLINLKVVKDV
jgi:hypothetical protein